MDDSIQAIQWEAHPHMPRERGSDWYWILGLLAVSGSVAAIILGSVLFGVVILLGALVMAVHTIYESHEPIPYEISQAGVRIDTKLTPYAKIHSFYIDREHYHGPHLLLSRIDDWQGIISVPIPEEYVDEIDTIIAARVPEEHLQESIPQKLLEIVGF